MRKRDRIRGIFRAQSPNAPVVSQSNAPVASQSSTASSSTSVGCARDFLELAIKALPEAEAEVIRGEITSANDSTIDSIYDAAVKQKRACEEKRWPGSDKADKILLWLDRFKAVGDVIANVDPMHVGLPWAGIRILLDTATADIRQMTSLLDGMNLALSFANRLQAYFEFYARLPHTPTSTNFQKSLVQLYVHLLRFLASAMITYQMNTALRKLQALWQISDVEAFEAQCDKLGVRADIEANACFRDLYSNDISSAIRWREGLEKALKELDEIQFVTESLKFLDMKVVLAKLDQSVAHEAIYNSSAESKLSLCLDGTRSEVIDSIRQWATAPDAKLIYWLCGKAGTGKSTISRTIARMFDQKLGPKSANTSLAASFFFKRGEQKRSHADLFVPTIVAQIADLIPQLRAPIADVLDKDAFICAKGLQEQFEKLLLEPLSSLDPAHLPQRPTVIVVDALDECDRNTDFRLFLRLLAQSRINTKLHLRIFVTSRPELPIQLGFRQLDHSLHNDIRLEEVQEPTIRHDIRVFINDNFEKVRQERSDDTSLVDWPSADDLHKLVDLAVPLFIFASTVCRFVAEKTPRTRLQHILTQPSSIMQSQLAAVYLPVLDHLLHDKEQPGKVEVIKEFRKIVGPIILAANPLSVTSLAGLLDIDPQNIDPQNINDEINDLLRHLHSVLEIPTDLQEPIRLLHLSFRDFLIDPELKYLNRFWIDEVETHKNLAFGCLKRLNKAGALRTDICHVVHIGTRRTELPAQQVSLLIPPDVAYACSYWPLHFIKSGLALHDGDVVHEFLKTHLLHWLEVLSWLGRLHSAILSISDLLALKQVRECNEVVRFLQDVRRFLFQNIFVMDLAPLQTYHSAILFAPMQSIVRQIYHEQASQQWDALPAIPLNWGAEEQRLIGHDGVVFAVAFSPDGEVIASGSDDTTVRLWSVATGEQMQTLRGHTKRVTAVTFSPDGQLVVSASWDYTVLFWNAMTGEQVRKLESDVSLHAVAFSPDGQNIALETQYSQLLLQNIASGRQIQMFDGEESRISAIAFSPNEHCIASGFSDGIIRFWDIPSGLQTLELKGHSEGVNDLCFTHDGSLLASVSHDRIVQLWCTTTGENLMSWGKDEREGEYALSVAFSPDGQLLALGHATHTIVIWNIPANRPIQELKGHDDFVSAVAFSPDSQTLVSGSGDNTVRLWSVSSSDTQRELELTENLVEIKDQDLWNQQSVIYDITFSPDGRLVASGSTDGFARLWHASTWEQILELDGEGGCVSGVAFSPDGLMLASGTSNNVRIWDIATSRMIQQIPFEFGWFEKIAFSADGRVIAISTTRKLEVWDWATSTLLLYESRLYTDSFVIDLTFSPDGQKIAEVRDASIAVYDLASRRIQELQGFENAGEADVDGQPVFVSNTSAFSEDGEYCTAVSMDGKLRRWNVATGELIQTTKTIDQDLWCFRGDWICCQGHDILWVPMEYRPHSSAVHERTLLATRESKTTIMFRHKGLDQAPEVID